MINFPFESLFSLHQEPQVYSWQEAISSYEKLPKKRRTFANVCADSESNFILQGEHRLQQEYGAYMACLGPEQLRSGYLVMTDLFLLK